MATACVDEFDEWLCTKLVNTDQDVFVSYIRGILEGDEAKDEKLEGLEGILTEIMSGNTLNLSHEIMDRWDKLSLTLNNEVPAELEVDVNAKLARIMEKQTLSVVPERKISDEERQYKDAILAQYSHVSDHETDDEDEVKPKTETKPKSESVDAPPANPTSSGAFVVKNTNAEEVAKAEKEKRDKAKGESEKKKATDKANKEKQKQQQQERKEKEKKRTQKGERKR